jgi:hypothetical protein
MRKSLTQLAVERTTAPATGRVEIPDGVVPGLFLIITSKANRSFVVRARIAGKPDPIRFTIGDATAIKLADARETASAWCVSAKPESTLAKRSARLLWPKSGPKS